MSAADAVVLVMAVVICYKPFRELFAMLSRTSKHS